MSKQRKNPPPTLSPRDWAPLKAAFAQVAVIVGADKLAAHDLTQDLREGLLVAAWRSPDGNETRLLKPSEWRQWRVQPPSFMPRFSLSEPLRELDAYVTPVDDNAPPVVAGHFSVRRRKLDQRYPATTPSERRADDKQPMPPLRSKPGPQTRTPTPGPTTSDRRKPGPKIKRNWRLHVAAEAHRIWKEEGSMPGAPELAAFCGEKLGYVPEETDIRNVLRFLLSE